MVEWLADAGKPYLVVATKSDKLSGSRLKPRVDRTRATLNSLGCQDFLTFSAVTGAGRDAVWKWIRTVVDG